MPKSFLLRVNEPGVQEKTFRIENTTSTVTCGRGSTMDFQVSVDSSVSRHQFTLTWKRNGLHLKNMGKPMKDKAGSVIGEGQTVPVKGGLTLNRSSTCFIFEENDNRSLELVVEVQGDTKRYPFEKDSLTVGKNDENDVVVKADGVSKSHLLLTVEKGSGGVHVQDVGSTNGFHVLSPVPKQYAPCSSATVELNQKFSFGVAVGRVVLRKTASKTMYYIAGALAVITLALILFGKRPPESDCRMVMADCLQNTDFEKCMDALANTFSGNPAGLKKCPTCRKALERYEAEVRSLSEYRLRAKEYNKISSLCAASLLETVWARDPKELKKRDELVLQLRKGADSFSRDFSALIAETSKSAASPQDWQRFVSSIRTSSCATINWRPLSSSGTLDPLPDSVLLKGNLVRQLVVSNDLFVTRLFDTGRLSPADQEAFRNVIRQIPDVSISRIEAVQGDITRYHASISAREQQWKVLEEAYRVALGNPARKPFDMLKPLEASTQLPDSLTNLLARQSLDTLYGTLLVGENEGFPSVRSRREGWSWSLDRIEKWPPQDERAIGAPYAARIRELCRDYTVKAYGDFRKITEILGGNELTVTRLIADCEPLNMAQRIERLDSLAGSLENQLNALDVDLFHITGLSGESKRTQETVIQSTERWLESLRTFLEIKVYSPDLIQQKELAQSFKKTLARLCALEQRYEAVSVFRSGNIIGFKRLFDRLSEELGDSSPGR